MSGRECFFWPTANGTDDQRGGQDWTEKQKQRERGLPGILSYAAAQWPTSSSTDAQGHAYTLDNGDPEKRRPSLLGEAENWPTARENYWKSGQVSDEIFEKNSRPLTEAAERWPTAMAEDSEDAGSPLANHNTLGNATENWPTPNSNPDAPNNGTTRERGREAQRLTSQCLLERATSFPSSPPTKTISEAGSEYSQLTRLLCQLFHVENEEQLRKVPKQLNPRFVSWLMGWPPSWPSALIACGSAEMELYRSRLLSHLCTFGGC